MASIFERFNGLFAPSPTTGAPPSLMSRFDTPAAQIGLRMLAASGRSPVKRGFGEIAGQSILGYQSDAEQQALRKLQRDMLEAQMAKLKEPAAPEYRYEDLGNEVAIFANGKEVSRVPKGVSPDTAMREEGENLRWGSPSGNVQLQELGADRRWQLPSGNAVLSDKTTRRGQDISADTQRRGQDVQATASGKTGANRPLTEFQTRALTQVSRMENAELVLRGPDGKSGVEYTPSLTAAAAAEVPMIGNKLTSEAFQNYTQAAREWISGLLRLDSGAAVPEVEFQRYFKTYFAQPGDGAAVVKQKRAARLNASKALRDALGSIGGSSIPDAAPPAADDSGWGTVEVFADGNLPN